MSRIMAARVRDALGGALKGALAADLRENAFAGLAPDRARPLRIGAEAEFLVFDDAGRVCPLESDEGPALLPFLRRFSERRGWREERSLKGAPYFSLPSGGTITFEPGGQLEFSAPPCRSATTLLASLRAVILPLRSAALEEGITLLPRGIDPYNPIEAAPLQIAGGRYRRMASYFERIGPAGARMMRQTAAFQLGLDFGTEPVLLWRVLNRAAPFLIAIFANSPLYAGSPTGHRSYRAATWREVDPRRTGVWEGESDPVRSYLEFALRAPAFLAPGVESGGEGYPTFDEIVAGSGRGIGAWHTHLTTLFPEVRPRGYLEIRSPDAVPPEWYAAPIALLSGIAYDQESRHAAAELLPPPTPALLERSGAAGLTDPAIARTARALFEIALEGCARLGAGWIAPAELATARDYFERFTARGQSPGDEMAATSTA
jgi:glutamate--cysteine ligase